jgi:hypothetical protein
VPDGPYLTGLMTPTQPSLVTVRLPRFDRCVCPRPPQPLRRADQRLLSQHRHGPSRPAVLTGRSRDRRNDRNVTLRSSGPLRWLARPLLPSTVVPSEGRTCVDDRGSGCDTSSDIRRALDAGSGHVEHDRRGHIGRSASGDSESGRRCGTRESHAARGQRSISELRAGIRARERPCHEVQVADQRRRHR